MASPPFCLISRWLEDELRDKLHDASVIGEGLGWIVERRVIDANERRDGRKSNRVHRVDTARKELGVVEDVECLRLEFK